MTAAPEPPPYQGRPVPPPWSQPAPYWGPAGAPVPGYPPPGYPWGPAPVAPRKSGRKLLIAGALLLNVAIISGVLAAWLMAGVFRAQPLASDQFASGSSTAVQFEAGQTKVIYVESADSPPQKVVCGGEPSESAGTARSVTIDPIGDDITINSWKAAFSVTAQQPGLYTLTCTGAPGDTFGVGGPASVGGIGAAVALILLSVVTALTGLITGIIGLARQLRRTR